MVTRTGFFHLTFMCPGLNHCCSGFCSYKLHSCSLVYKQRKTRKNQERENQKRELSIQWLRQ
uniref:Uncharacterized protein n=1 Tax=Anguilla anguilla TaxID=7936 RepID=A0A0E9XSK4_ANGAN